MYTLITVEGARYELTASQIAKSAFLTEALREETEVELPALVSEITPWVVQWLKFERIPIEAPKELVDQFEQYIYGYFGVEDYHSECRKRLKPLVRNREVSNNLLSLYTREMIKDYILLDLCYLQSLGIEVGDLPADRLRMQAQRYHLAVVDDELYQLNLDGVLSLDGTPINTELRFISIQNPGKVWQHTVDMLYAITIDHKLYVWDLGEHWYLIAEDVQAVEERPYYARVLKLNGESWFYSHPLGDEGPEDGPFEVDTPHLYSEVKRDEFGMSAFLGVDGTLYLEDHNSTIEDHWPVEEIENSLLLKIIYDQPVVMIADEILLLADGSVRDYFDLSKNIYTDAIVIGSNGVLTAAGLVYYLKEEQITIPDVEAMIGDNKGGLYYRTKDGSIHRVLRASCTSYEADPDEE